jgi:hypothetical protein
MGVTKVRFFRPPGERKKFVDNRGDEFVDVYISPNPTCIDSKMMRVLPVSFYGFLFAVAVIHPSIDRSIQKQDILREGDGKTFPKKGDKLQMHYKGTLASNGTKFDSSYDRGKPFQFKIGRGDVIKVKNSVLLLGHNLCFLFTFAFWFFVVHGWLLSSPQHCCC